MSLDQQFPAISQHIATAMEQLGGLSDETLFGLESAADNISQCFANGGKLMILSTPGLQGIGATLHYDLMHAYRLQQPALPTLLLAPAVDNNRLTQHQLHEADTLAQPHDTLMLLCDYPFELDTKLLEQLYQFRETTSLYVGPTDQQAVQTAYSSLLPVNAKDIYAQRELMLFILHCLSARIQSMLFDSE